MAPPRSDEDDHFGRLFLFGLLLGLIPMGLLFLGISWTPYCFRGCQQTSAQIATQQLASSLLSAGTWAWGLAAALAIILLFIRRLRPVGYALLVMAAITPCAAVTGCVVRLPSPYG